MEKNDSYMTNEVINLLIIQTGPVCTDKVPRQRLANAVAGNRGDNGGGVHPPDLLSVQTIRQVPEHTHQESYRRGAWNPKLQDKWHS